MLSTKFYAYNSEVRYRKSDGTDLALTENDEELISYLLAKVETFYPEALDRLSKKMKKRLPNTRFYRFGMADRYARCNFGSIDNIADLTGSGSLNNERVSCPLRGVCEDENVICNPKFNSRISDSEMRVLELWYRGENKESIADRLCLSIHTVNNHIRNALTRLGFHEKADFIDYAHRNKLFKD